MILVLSKSRDVKNSWLQSHVFHFTMFTCILQLPTFQGIRPVTGRYMPFLFKLHKLLPNLFPSLFFKPYVSHPLDSDSQSSDSVH
jgi:hypothetical protein